MNVVHEHLVVVNLAIAVDVVVALALGASEIWRWIFRRRGGLRPHLWVLLSRMPEVWNEEGGRVRSTRGRVRHLRYCCTLANLVAAREVKAGVRRVRESCDEKVHFGLEHMFQSAVQEMC